MSLRRALTILRILPMLFLALTMILGPVHAASPIQITPVSGCAGNSDCAYPDIIGVESGASAGSAFAKDQFGNLIALVACSNFSNQCSGHFGILAWSNDGGNTWQTCVTLGNCGAGAQTTNIMQSTGSTCIHAGALYVSGSTVDVAYAKATVNTASTFFVDRMQISYSGQSITNIANGGPETSAAVSDQATSGFSCVQQILPTPNGGGEIMIFAVEENSGPLYMFRTGVTTSAFKDLSGTASSVSSTIVSQSDGSNSCVQFQPVTGDIWDFDVYDRAGGSVITNQYPYNSGTGNWGAVTSHTVATNDGVPLLTKSAACVADSVDKIAFFSWFRCLTSGGAICASGAPVAGNVCTFQLWEATSSSSGAIPTQLATLTDTGACHQTNNNSNVGGGGSLTYVSGQLYLTGVDDNVFGSGCSTEGGGNDAFCQQLFYAKYSIAGNTWGSITKFPGTPSAVLGVSAFASGTTLNLLYSNCNNYVGTTNSNDGACGVATGNSLFFDPLVVPPTTVCNNFSSGAESASALIVLILIMIVVVFLWGLVTGVIPAEYHREAVIVVVFSVMIFVFVLAVTAAFQNCG